MDDDEEQFLLNDDDDEDEDDDLIPQVEDEIEVEENYDEMEDDINNGIADQEVDQNHNVGLIQHLRLHIRNRYMRADHNKVRNRPTEITYDPSLPTTHSYLGNDLEEYSGRTILDEDSYVSLPLLQLPGVILVPGQTLPLHEFNQRINQMFRHCIQTNRTFGMVHGLRRESPGGDTVLPTIGTTAEIYSAKEDEDSGIETIRIKATGRQRFQVMEERRQADGILIGTVRILRECELPEPLEGARLWSGNRCRVMPCLAHLHGAERDAQWLKHRRKRYLCAANWTQMPSWVYEMYDADILMFHIKTELRSWYEDSVKFEAVPSSATGFSFWVAGNLPLSDRQRLELLEINCPVQRLRKELEILRKCTMLQCTECKLDIASKSDVFSMSLDGPMAAYVNPGGYVHDTLTVYNAHNLTLIGRPSKENSWFPGYAWTILQCRRCDHHMGWKFTMVQRNLKPKVFWGLTRSAVQPGFTDIIDLERPQI